MRAKTRFLAKVREEGSCWLWKGKKLSNPPNNYGRFYWNGGYVMAHRAAWVLYRGLIPDGMQVLHKCDNPPCVNPDHLFIGTQVDNIRDMCSKGRQRSCVGSTNSNAVLNESSVIELRKDRERGLTFEQLADKYGVSHRAARLAAIGETWRHVA